MASPQGNLSCPQFLPAHTDPFSGPPSSSGSAPLGLEGPTSEAAPLRLYLVYVVGLTAQQPVEASCRSP